MRVPESVPTPRIGVFGGTFDPPHLGHLVAAEQVRHQFSLETVFFVPSARPPHKAAAGLTDSSCRLEMTRLATQDNPDFAVSEIEVLRPGPSYTVDTIRQFQTAQPGTDIYFIMGRDSVVEITTWKDPDLLFQLCKVIVASRPGFDIDRAALEFREKVILTEITDIGISSSDIRRRVREGRSIRYLVPERVEAYILGNDLYR